MSNPTGVVKCVKPSIDSEEDRFNNGFYAASTDFDRTSDANNFASVSEIVPPDTEDFDRTSDANNFASVSEIVPPDTEDYRLKRLIKNDSYLRNLSSDSASIIPGRSPSLIIAAGTIAGSTANTSIASLQSTFLGGYLESDVSYSPGDATLKNMDIGIHPILDERLPIGKEDETASLVGLEAEASDNCDTEFESNTASCSSRYLELPPAVQHLTTISEESLSSPTTHFPQMAINETFITLRKNHHTPKREMTTDELDRLLHSAMPNDYSYSEESIAEWNNTGIDFDHILKSIQIARELEENQNESPTVFGANLLQSSSEPEASSNCDSGFDPNSASNFSSRYPGLSSNLQQFTGIFENSFSSNAHEQKFSGFKIMSLIEDLRNGPMPDLPQTAIFSEMCTNLAQYLTTSGKEITIDELGRFLLFALRESEYCSEQSTTIHSSGQSLDFHSGREVDRIFQHLRCMRESEKKIQDESFPSPSSGSSMFSEDFFKPKRVWTSVTKRKKFFSPLPNESRKESSFQETSGEINFSPKKNKVKFSSKVCQFSGDKPQKKYVGTPRFRRNEKDEQPKDVETGKEDSFLHREQNIDTITFPKVALLRKLFSPGGKTQGLSRISVNIPRIKVVKATPKRTVNTPLDTANKEFRKKIRSPSGERKSPRKSWKP